MATWKPRSRLVEVPPAGFAPAASFTSTSGIGWSHSGDYSRGRFAINMEAWLAATDAADLTENIPYGITQLWIDGGSIKYALKSPGNSDALFHVAIIGDPGSGDTSMGPGSAMILDYIVPIRAAACCMIPIAPFAVPCADGWIQVPADGSGYQIKVHVDCAGNNAEQGDFEFAVFGRWTTLPLTSV